MKCFVPIVAALCAAVSGEPDAQFFGPALPWAAPHMAAPHMAPVAPAMGRYNPYTPYGMPAVSPVAAGLATPFPYYGLQSQANNAYVTVAHTVAKRSADATADADADAFYPGYGFNPYTPYGYGFNPYSAPVAPVAPAYAPYAYRPAPAVYPFAPQPGQVSYQLRYVEADTLQAKYAEAKEAQEKKAEGVISVEKRDADAESDAQFYYPGAYPVYPQVASPYYRTAYPSPYYQPRPFAAPMPAPFAPRYSPFFAPNVVLAQAQPEKAQMEVESA